MGWTFVGGAGRYGNDWCRRIRVTATATGTFTWHAPTPPATAWFLDAIDTDPGADLTGYAGAPPGFLAQVWPGGVTASITVTAGHDYWLVAAEDDQAASSWDPTTDFGTFTDALSNPATLFTAATEQPVTPPSSGSAPWNYIPGPAGYFLGYWTRLIPVTAVTDIATGTITWIPPAAVAGWDIELALTTALPDPATVTFPDFVSNVTRHPDGTDSERMIDVDIHDGAPCWIIAGLYPNVGFDPFPTFDPTVDIGTFDLAGAGVAPFEFTGVPTPGLAFALTAGLALAGTPNTALAAPPAGFVADDSPLEDYPDPVLDAFGRPVP